MRGTKPPPLQVPPATVDTPPPVPGAGAVSKYPAFKYLGDSKLLYDETIQMTVKMAIANTVGDCSGTAICS